ncbi:MAG: hypothetical protein QXJ64_05455 [Thermosphaera sp.]
MRVSNNILEKHLIFTIFISFVSIVIIYPVMRKVVNGEVFGGDVGQYLISAYAIVHGRNFVYNYPYPLISLIYVPIVLLLKDSFIQYVIGCLLGPILMILLVVATYLSITSLINDKNYIKNSIASTLGSVPVAFFPLYLDAIGWGGQAQFLGLILGMILIRFYIERKSIHFMITSILLVLAHPWTASYFILALTLHKLILLCIEVKNAIIKKKYIILNMLKFTLFPLLTFLILSYFPLGKEDMVGIPINNVPVIKAIMKGELDLISFIRRLTFPTETVLLFLSISFFIFLFSRLSSLSKRNGDQSMSSYSNVLLIRLLLILSFLYIVICPAQYADRGFYIIPIPLSLHLGRALSDYMSKLQPSHIDFKGDKASRAFLLLFLSIFFLGSYSGGAIMYYPSSLSYYGIPSDLFYMNNILGEVNDNVLLITPHALWFPASGILKTNVFVTSQPVWFIQKKQIEYVEYSNMLAWGNLFLRCNRVVVVDSQPLWPQPSPAIFVSDYPYFVELFRLSDSFLRVQLNHIDSSGTIWQDLVHYTNRITTEWGSNQSYGYIAHLYELNTLVVRKLTRLYINSTVEIKLDYNFIDSIPESIEHQLIFLVMRSLGKDLFLNYIYADSRRIDIDVTQYFKEPWLIKKITTNISINAENALIDYFGHEDAGLWSFLRMRYKPLNTDNVSITISIRIHSSFLEDGHEYCHLKPATREDIIKHMNLRYIIIDRDFHQDAFHIIDRDLNFYKYSEVGRYVIYRFRSNYGLSKPQHLSPSTCSSKDILPYHCVSFTLQYLDRQQGRSKMISQPHY